MAGVIVSGFCVNDAPFSIGRPKSPIPSCGMAESCGCRCTGGMLDCIIGPK